MGRTIIVGDIHGCRDELSDLLEACAFAGGDRVIAVGDLVAKGPDSRGVIEMARTLAWDRRATEGIWLWPDGTGFRNGGPSGQAVPGSARHLQ